MTVASETARLERKTQQFVDMLAAQGTKPIYQLSYSDARQVLENLQSQPVDKTPAIDEDVTIPVGPSGQVSLTIVRPENVVGMLATVMYFHGGGWVLGSRNTHDRLIREIANGANAAVVFVNYTRSPEAQYPVPIEEAYAATKYVAEHGEKLSLDSSRLVIVGDSVGGNMAAVVAILAKQRGGPQIDYQVLLYPVTDAGFNTPSYQMFSDGPWLMKAAMQWFWDAYCPDKSKRDEVTASPLRASVEDLMGLPPALVITDENDVLRDEGEIYAHKLMTAGVDVTAVRSIGTLHDFMMLNPLSKTPATRCAVGLVNEMLRNVFGSEQAGVEFGRERGRI